MILLIVLALAIVWAIVTTRTPTTLRSYNYMVLSIGVLGILVAGHSAAPGYAFAPLLLLGVVLSAAGGKTGRLALLPLVVVLLPLSFVISGPYALSVDSPWVAAGLLCAGAAVGYVAREVSGTVARRQSAVVSWFWLLAWCLPAVAVLAYATPWHGINAWNMILPMVSTRADAAKLVVLHENSLQAWPWLEPLQYGVLAVVAMSALVLLLGAVKKKKSDIDVVSLLGTVVIVALGAGVILMAPGAWSPLEHIDAARVMEVIRPPFVPHDAVTYLTPETDSWKFSRAALAVWVGLTGWLATLPLISHVDASSTTAADRVHPAVPAILFAVAGLFFAEALTAQAGQIVRQVGMQGYTFGLAALAAGAALQRGRLRIVFQLLLVALSGMWIVLLISERVLG